MVFERRWLLLHSFSWTMNIMCISNVALSEQLYSTSCWRVAKVVVSKWHKVGDLAVNPSLCCFCSPGSFVTLSCQVTPYSHIVSIASHTFLTAFATLNHLVMFYYISFSHDIIFPGGFLTFLCSCQVLFYYMSNAPDACDVVLLIMWL